MPNNMNLHRNVFFKDCAKVPVQPFSALDSTHPVDLWNWMDGQRKAGNELLAISHNANLSDGRMFPTEVDSKGRPIDAAYAASRVRNEPLIEIKQLKGSSETHPLLSPSDEFANFELMSVLLGDPSGRIPHIVGSYARQALKDGLAMQDTRGINPYKFGFGAASDSHNTAVPYRQDNFFGGHSFTDGTPEVRMAGNLVGGFFDARTESTAGLTGVWAEENTRASLFEAMQRKETFAVSGPHIKVRLFGGWEYAAADLCRRRLGEDGLRERRADGRRPAAGQGQGADVHRVGGEGPDVRQPRPHPDRQGLDEERPELREDLRRRLVRRSQAQQVDRRGAAGRQHGGRRERDVHEHDRRRGAEDGVDRSGIRSGRRTRSITRACSKSRRRAGPRSRPSSSASRRPTSWRPPCRSAPGARPSGTPRARTIARTRRPA